MQIKIKRIDKSLPLPEYKTSGSVGFDLYAREETIVPAHHFAVIPTNLIVKTPPGHMLMLAARSSSARHKGLTMRNGIGVIDQDYSGEEDELKIMAQNLSDEDKTVERGERIAQGIFVKIEIASWLEVDTMEDQSRGGMGSTGLN